MRTSPRSLRPGIRELTRGHQPGDVVARLDLDPYHRSFRNVCTHILAPELTGTGDPRGASPGPCLCLPRLDVRPDGFPVRVDRRPMPMRHRRPPGHGRRGEARVRAASCVARFPVVLPRPADQERAGGRGSAEEIGSSISVSEPGVYRVEGWLSIGGEERGWLYCEPHLREIARCASPAESPMSRSRCLSW